MGRGKRPVGTEPYHSPESQEDALDILEAEFDLPRADLEDLAQSFIGLARPAFLPKENAKKESHGTKDLPDSFPRVLGFVGYMHAGKDVAAGFLGEMYKDVHLMAFSDPIIVECNKFLAKWGHLIAEENKDDYRSFLQNWSMARRSEQEDYWSLALRDEIDQKLAEGKFVVLTGVRLPADVRLIEDYQGELWRVVRPTVKKSPHPNEAWISEIACQYTIYNEVEGDTTPLRSQLEERISQIGSSSHEEIERSSAPLPIK